MTSPAAPGDSLRIDSSSADPPQTRADVDAIDQFELVLKTLGLSLDEEEPPLHPAGEPFAETVFTAPDPPSEPTRTIENIVLEGDEVSQSQAQVPDKPLDELELFTQRMTLVTGGVEPAASPGPSPAPRAPSARPPAARAPLPTRRGSTGRAPAARVAPAAPGEGATPDVGAPASKARTRSDERTFEEQAQLDEALLADRTLDEPLEGESTGSLEPAEAEAAAADLYVANLTARALPYRWAWIAGCIALAVLLLLQALHHWRERLATSATWGAPVRQLYAAIGAPLAPHWDLNAYEVRQQGAQFEPGPRQTIRVRFSLANHAPHAQPVPLLRLTLLDRYGRRIAQRDLAPADYWPTASPPAAFLASDQRIDTEVQVRDPGADSASFELDVCLRGAQGLVHCAGDAAAAAASAGGAL